MKNKKMNLIELIDKVLEDDGKLLPITIGQVIIIWGVVPLTLGIIYLIVFNSITKTMAYTLPVPSVVATAFWWLFREKRWFSRSNYF